MTLHCATSYALNVDGTNSTQSEIKLKEGSQRSPKQPKIIVALAILLLLGLTVGYYATRFYTNVKRIQNGKFAPGVQKNASPTYDPKKAEEERQRNIQGVEEKKLSERIFTLVAIGGSSVTQKLGKQLATSSVEYYNPRENIWKEAPPMRQARRGHAATVSYNRIYVFGGVEDKIDFQNPTTGQVFHRETILNTVEEFSPSNGTWINKYPIPVNWQGGAALTVSGKIYIVGGRNEKNENLPDVYIFNPLLNSWTVGAPMPVAKNLISTRGCSAQNLNIYCPEAGEGQYTLVYDTVTDTWKSFATENRSNVNFGMGATYEGKTYSIVATPYDSYISIYNPNTDTVNKDISIPKVRWEFGTAGYLNYLFSVGGKWSNDPYTEAYAVNLYGYPAIVWFNLPPLIHPRSDVAVVILPILYGMDVSEFGSIEGKIYSDQNSNLQFDPEEQGIPNVELILQTKARNVNNEITLLTTDNEGNYQFSGLFPGTYEILVKDPLSDSGGFSLVTIKSGTTYRQQFELEKGEKLSGINYGLR